MVGSIFCPIANRSPATRLSQTRAGGKCAGKDSGLVGMAGSSNSARHGCSFFLGGGLLGWKASDCSHECGLVHPKLRAMLPRPSKKLLATGVRTQGEPAQAHASLSVFGFSGTCRVPSTALSCLALVGRHWRKTAWAHLYAPFIPKIAHPDRPPIPTAKGKIIKNVQVPLELTCCWFKRLLRISENNRLKKGAVELLLLLLLAVPSRSSGQLLLHEASVPLLQGINKA